MKKLLVLGSSKGCREMISYARSQGIWTIVTDFDDVSKSWAKPLADELWIKNAEKRESMVCVVE